MWVGACMCVGFECVCVGGGGEGMWVAGLVV